MRTLIRTNLAGNTGGEINTTGWTSNDGTKHVVSRETNSPIAGLASIIATRTATSPSAIVSSLYISSMSNSLTGLKVTPGDTITASLDIRQAIAGRKASIYLAFRDNVSAVVGTTSPTDFMLDAGRINRIYQTAVVPATSDSMLIIAQVQSVDASNVNTGEIVYHDNLLVEKAASVGDFFDGSTPESFYLYHKWTGTPNASTSEQYRIEVMENFNPQLALQDAKMKSLEKILGPSPVKTQNGSLTENQYAAMEKVLRDNALIV